MENQPNGSITKHKSDTATGSRSVESRKMLIMNHKALAELLGRRDVDCDIVRRIGCGIGQVNSNGVELSHTQLVNTAVPL